MWPQLIVFVVTSILQYLLTPKPEGPKAAKLSDFDIPTTEEGTPVTFIIGHRWVKNPIVAWYGDYKVKAIKAGKK